MSRAAWSKKAEGWRGQEIAFFFLKYSTSHQRVSSTSTSVLLLNDLAFTTDALNFISGFLLVQSGGFSTEILQLCRTTNSSGFKEMEYESIFFFTLSSFSK